MVTLIVIQCYLWATITLQNVLGLTANDQVVTSHGEGLWADLAFEF